mmetsp:Transcript_5092/g.12514  ORF Transcript_5092/g.12514 Transcript_5092/m.12514 type:complete len:264 (+) Transcript_5092:298-1089(+)
MEFDRVDRVDQAAVGVPVALEGVFFGFLGHRKHLRIGQFVEKLDAHPALDRTEAESVSVGEESDASGLEFERGIPLQDGIESEVVGVVVVVVVVRQHAQVVETIVTPRSGHQDSIPRFVHVHGECLSGQNGTSRRGISGLLLPKIPDAELPIPAGRNHHVRSRHGGQTRASIVHIHIHVHVHIHSHPRGRSAVFVVALVETDRSHGGSRRVERLDASVQTPRHHGRCVRNRQGEQRTGLHVVCEQEGTTTRTTCTRGRSLVVR